MPALEDLLRAWVDSDRASLLTATQLKAAHMTHSLDVLVWAGDDERALQMSGVIPSLFRVSTQTMNRGTAVVSHMPAGTQDGQDWRPVDIDRIATRARFQCGSWW